MRRSTAAAAFACLLSSSFVSAISSVTIKGNAFFAGDKRFYLRGLDYQPGGDAGRKDPLADINVCTRDLAKFQQLGINAVRVYTIDNSANHDDCMKLLSDAGIYVAVDVSWSKFSLDREYPEAMRRSYNEIYLQSVFATMDSFAKYDNLLAFFAANEVITINETWAAPFIKAQIRDMKQYISARNLRKIPVGYAATDKNETRYQIATYLNCGPDEVRTDFVAFNDYAWCGPQAFAASDWAKKVKLFSNYSAPMFLSEYGCIDVQPRTFSDVGALYSSDMTPIYSGGLVYEYSFEKVIIPATGAAYGIVNISGNSVTDRPDFSALQTAFKTTPLPSDDGGYSATNKASLCPPSSHEWQVNSSMPSIPPGAVKFMSQGAGPGPGLTGVGSQWAGTPSSGAWIPIGAASDGSASSSNSTTSTPKKSTALATFPPNVLFLLLGMTFLCVF